MNFYTGNAFAYRAIDGVTATATDTDYFTTAPCAVAAKSNENVINTTLLIKHITDQIFHSARM